jgi:hypothetical protein
MNNYCLGHYHVQSKKYSCNNNTTLLHNIIINVQEKALATNKQSTHTHEYVYLYTVFIPRNKSVSRSADCGKAIEDTVQMLQCAPVSDKMHI